MSKPIDTRISNVLFSDIKSFSQLSIEQGEDFLVHVVSPVAEMADKLGLNNRNMWGDAFFVVADDTRKLCRLALDMRDHFENLDWRAFRLPKLDIRISIHQGRHLSGENPFTKTDWVFGQTINVAARIEPITEPGQIWVTDEVATAVHREPEPPFFVDMLGDRYLSKNAGVEKLHILKRSNESRLTDADRKQLQIDYERLIEADKPSKPYEIAIGVIVAEHRVVLVRPCQPLEGQQWQLPAVALKPNVDVEAALWKEMKHETGVVCSVHEKLGARVHPTEGIMCHYYRLEPLGGTMDDISNGDPNENEAVVPVEYDRALDLLGGSTYEGVVNLLKARV